MDCERMDFAEVAFLSLGPREEVLEPRELRERVRTLAQETALLYDRSGKDKGL